MTNTEDATVSLLYAERDIESLGFYYGRHVVAMTAEKLHNKSDIVAELAYRDQALDSQAKLLEEARRLVDKARQLACIANDNGLPEIELDSGWKDALDIEQECETFLNKLRVK